MNSTENDSNELKQKIGWIDTHCHVNYSPLIDSLPEVILEAEKADVKKMVCIGTNLDKADDMIAAIQQYDNIFYTIGHHPCQEDMNADEIYNLLNDKLGKLVNNHFASDDAMHDKNICKKINNRLVGIGETGLDCTNSNIVAQTDIFHAHLALAKKYHLPVVVHSRDMDQALLESLKAFSDVRGVLHCWTGAYETAMKAVDLGWKVSFSGILTFKKKVEYLHEQAAKLPLEAIVIETDSPYLAPDPYRGKTNQPAFVKLVGEKLAQLRCMPIDKLQSALWENSHELFGL
jgi:TatD DNase family protein